MTLSGISQIIAAQQQARAPSAAQRTTQPPAGNPIEAKLAEPADFEPIAFKATAAEAAPSAPAAKPVGPAKPLGSQVDIRV